MYPLHLSAAQTDAFIQTLRSTYTKKIHVRSLTRTGTVVADLSSHFQDGQVQVDGSADITRATAVTLFDPDRKIGFDIETYQGGALDWTHDLEVKYEVNSPLLSEAVTIPVHRGPVISLHRDGNQVQAGAAGREWFLGFTLARAVTYRRGAKITDVIRNFLIDHIGETRVVIPDLPQKLHTNVTFDTDNPPLAKLRSLAQAVNRQFYYDGSGTARLRILPNQPQWSFMAGPGVASADITSSVQTDATLDGVKNRVIVRGAPAHGKVPQVVYMAIAPASHPLSPGRLGAGKAPMYLTEIIDNPHIRTVADAKAVAETELANYLRLAVEVDFNSIPIPHFDPDDLIHVFDGYVAGTHRLTKFTLPLGNGEMTVGRNTPTGLRPLHPGHAVGIQHGVRGPKPKPPKKPKKKHHKKRTHHKHRVVHHHKRRR